MLEGWRAAIEDKCNLDIETVLACPTNETIYVLHKARWANIPEAPV
ncbi:unnamed protein product [Penicillium camemberti]|uniref:Str. FM013 n=1 Tax=Penicillium camemberti (strain FM 013) TaxID=1429867 RepID=A0A0G4PW49_PENC3|nr:unnamed protein product [Penicillium camemberti]